MALGSQVLYVENGAVDSVGVEEALDKLEHAQHVNTPKIHRLAV